MNKLAMWGVLGVLAFGTLLGVSKFNALSKYDEKADSALSLVDTQLQKRADLLGNLAETAKGYANHEQKTLIETAQARAGAAKVAPTDPKTGKPATPEELAKNADLQKKMMENQAAAAAATQQAMVAINAVREAYPDLKASPLFSKLMTELSDTEKKIQATRAMSNLAVRRYNSALRTFPGNIVASLGGFEKKHYFEVDASAKAAPKLKF